jgi:hypothetical protein
MGAGARLPLELIYVCARRHGRGSHSSAFQLNVRHFWHTMHPKHTLIPPNTS